MTFDGVIARLFRMSDATWARHASGWSVWPRFAILPLLLAAVWSHTWLGWWAAVPVVAVIVFTWLNPRLAPVPASTHTWHAKATFGERVWLARRAVPIPAHHARAALWLSVVAGLGVVPAFAGAWLNHGWLTGLGLLLTYGGKVWFLDRMVWLYEDMKDADPVYRSWLR